MGIVRKAAGIGVAVLKLAAARLRARRCGQQLSYIITATGERKALPSIQCDRWKGHRGGHAHVLRETGKVITW